MPLGRVGVNRQKHLIYAQNSFTTFPQPANLCALMTDVDLALWGMIVVPIGVAICFGPALLCWLRDEFGPDADARDYPNKKR
jgi:hypothetical protein